MKKKLPAELGTERIWKLLIRYAIPSVIAMTAASLYNITDSIFIGRGVDALAIAGLAITFPLMNLAAAFGSLIGSGAATLMSLRLGQRDYENAGYILGNVVTLNLILGTAYTIAVLIFLDPILYFFGASEATIAYAREYMWVITLGNVVTHTYFGLNAMLRSTGYPEKAMFATICAVVLNALMSYVFIFLFGWGIKGAAWATVLAQLIMLGWQFVLFGNKSAFVRFRWTGFRLKRKIMIDSLSIGMSPFLMNAAACMIVILINRQLTAHGGDMAVGAYGIVNRVATLFVMLIFGLNLGMQPIAGYNFGAQYYKRVNQVFRMTMALATGVMITGFLLTRFFPSEIAAVFTKDRTLIEMSASALRIAMLFYPLLGFQIVITNFFQSIGMAGKSIFLSLTRQVLFLLPCIAIFPLFMGVDGVWYSLPVADLASSIVAVFMFAAYYRKTKLNGHG